jgi:ectoine hydroxylase-related dioxygenase (phytanoyl-CoA dioxygenase family)
MTAQISIDEFAAVCAQKTVLADFPLADAVQSNVLIYDCAALAPMLSESMLRQEIMEEWARAFLYGPGVIVLQGAEKDHAVIDTASAVFHQIIADQARTGTGGGDHFAKPGANDRIWNALEKHCLANPQNFVSYYANPFLALVAEAWLGPNYQMTAQVNVVNPGGAAQSAHRDYHLGFQSAADIARYPAHVQTMSPLLTLQGALAHIDTPIETGPTLLLPFSQQYAQGYLAMGLPAFRNYFDAHHVQLPLKKGDMLFFSPALFHAAGANKSAEVRRMVNLFQISSAYGRAMESVNRTRMIKAIYPVLLAAQTSGSMLGHEISAAIAASAEGYAFPTNLDQDPPIGGMAPKSEAVVVTEALASGWTMEVLVKVLDAMAEKKRA